MVHSHDFFNDKVDSLIKDTLQTAVLTPSLNHLQQLRFFPRWKHIPIEDHLRRFLVSLTRNRGFEQWLNL